MALQRLSASLTIERRIGRILSPLYKRQQRQMLVAENGRVYVECFVLAEQ